MNCYRCNADPCECKDGLSVYLGKCEDVLPTLPDASVQCCVTSPPYWALRDYGVDGQLGLEATPEAYVEKMVAVFREVRRVLRDDGTVWLNLGSSYASGDMLPSRSRPEPCEQPCGNDDTEPSDSQIADPACSHSHDAHQDETCCHHARTPGSNPQASQEPQPPLQTTRDTAPADSSSTGVDSSPSGVPQSTMPSLSYCASDASDPEVLASVCPRGLQTSSGDAPACVGTVACTSCTAGLQPTSGHRKSGSLPLVAACDDPLCRGDCGICWSYYTMRSLRFKAKDMIPMPWLLAMALQADGWYLRSDIIWHKPNPMPESVTDRPTKAHEYIFLLTKRPRYFYDADAVREDGPSYTRKAGGYNKHHEQGASRFGGKGGFSDSDVTTVGRNKRTVWTVPSRSFPGAHFATFPPDLIVPCILAGTSDKGCCPECGAPWKRVTDKTRVPTRPGTNSKVNRASDKEDSPYHEHSGMVVGNRDPQRHCTETRTVGWQPGCYHGYDPVPCVVCDPFHGAGTSGMVCRQLGRHYVGIELNQEYLDMSLPRLRAGYETTKPAPAQDGQARLFD